MNKQHSLLPWQLLFFALIFGALTLSAQLEVSVNKADAIYTVGQTAFFQVQATFSSSATYEIVYDDKAPVIESGSINLNAGQTFSIPYSQNEPGLVICRVNLNGIIKEAAAAFAPLEITPLEEEPGDFDAFWNQQKNLKNSLPIDPQITYLSESSYQTTYTFSLSNIEGRRIYGYISVPKAAGPFPASITLPPYGSSSAVVGADTESAEKGGMIAVSLSIHNSPVNQDDPNAYQPDNNANKDEFYYRYGLIGAMHVIDYLETRPDFDGNVCAMGVSQGAGLAIMLAGIDNRVSLVINSNPTMGQHVGYKYDRASGFPYYLSVADDNNQGNQAVFETFVNATKYYDAMFHARRFKGASFTLTGFIDMVVPSATALAAYNQLLGTKVLMISRDGGHNHPNEYWNGRFEFMRRHFDGANNAPFLFGPTNKGFFADAGPDVTVGTSANLNAQVFYDTDNLTNLSVFWKKVSGPGNVTFSNSSGYNTTADFSSNGIYVLQFVARDDRKLNTEGKIYYIADDVKVEVTGGGNPTFTLNLSCPADQSVIIPAGQNQTTVTWSNPTATSNCAGGASFFQLAGPQNGSSFVQGVYTISYRATDNCGNQQDCSFIITVTEEPTNTSNITLNCPSDIIVSAPAGDNAVTVSWTDPTASTTCTMGGNTGGGDCSSTFKSGYSYMGTFENSQFYISDGLANWTDAKAATEAAGGRLAIINNSAENDFIQQNINGQIVFIGISDNGQEGNLVWVDGSSLSYSNFPGGLNNSGDNDFGVFYPWNGEWDLNNQFVAKKYLLEIPCSSGGGDGNTVTISQTNGGANGSNFSIGTSSVTYSATDACGNVETCSFNVTVNAVTTNLSLTCPSDFSMQIPAGQSQTTVTWTTPTASTNCLGGANITQTGGIGNGGQFTAGTHTISYQASDNCGNVENCSFNITVTTTNTNLSISCPADKVFQIPAGQSQVSVNWNDPTTSTDCPGGATLNQTGGPPNFSQLVAGTYSISYDATDNCENTATCSFFVTVNQASATLSISCPSNLILQLPTGQTTMPLDWTNPIATADCPNGATITQTDGTPKFSEVGIGSYTISYEATDNCGNRETCSFIVTVEQASNNSTITLTCPADIIIEIPADQTSTSVSWTTPTATTTCTAGGGGNDCSGNFINGYSYLGEFQGSQYYKSNAPFNFALAKISAANEGGILAKINSVEENEFLRQNLGTDLAIIGLSDEETEGVFKWADGSDPGFIHFVSDLNNNSSDDYAYMNFWDGKWQLIPDYIYKQYILEIPCDGGNTGGTGSVSLSQIGGIGNGGNFPIGTSSITYQATDDCGNSKTCSFTVTVNQTPPSCININDGGLIGNNEENCSSFNPKKMSDVGAPLGSDVEYLWLKSENSCPTDVSQQINGATNADYNPSTINTTTYYTRLARKIGCTDWKASNCIEKKVNNCGNGAPMAVLSVSSNTVIEDFQITITFNEPVTSLDGYNLAITNGNWYGFTATSSTIYTVVIDPINQGNVTISIPASVAFDSDINGNIASEVLTVFYQASEDPSPQNFSCLIKPTSVIIEDGQTVGGVVNNIVNGSGLSVEDDITAEHGGGNLYDGVWLYNGTNVTLKFDLGQMKTIDGIALWNYTYHTWLVLKRRGVKDFMIATSTDGINYSANSFFTAGKTTPRGEKETAQVFHFPPVTTRYVRMQILNAIDDSFYVGLGEIRFTNNCPSPTQFIDNNNNNNNNNLIVGLGNSNIFRQSGDLINAEIFPNPTSDYFYIGLNTNYSSNTTIEVINELGSVIQKRHLTRINSEPIKIDLFNQSDGLFLVRILVDNELPIIKKVIKSRR